MVRLVTIQTTANSTPTETAKRRQYSAVNRNTRVLRNRIGRSEHVSRAPCGVYQLRAVAFVNLCAQAADVGLYDVGLGVEVKTPNLFEQHCARDDAAAMQHQVLEQLEFQ